MNFDEIDLTSDTYYTDEYISMYLKDGESIFDFSYQENENIFINKSIKRPIVRIGDFTTKGDFFDLETAYGYGGFYTNSNDQTFVENALVEYKKKCLAENVIAEFIRFHPLNNFPVKYANALDFNVYDRDVVIVDLKKDLWSTYKAKVRNTIKKSTEMVEVVESCDMDKFEQLYRMTMEKNNADEYYFFDEEMFKKLYSLKGTKLYAIKYDDDIVAMGFFMAGNQVGHYHLSANSPVSYKLNSNYALLNFAFREAIANDKSYFLLGGGISGDVKDPLLKFKKKFSDQTLPFYISGNVYNSEKYSEYIDIWNKQSSSEVKYFLKYRLKIH